MTKSAALRIRIAPELHQEFLEVHTLKDKFSLFLFLNPQRDYKKYPIKELENFIYSASNRSQPEVHGLFITPSHVPNSLCIIL